MQADSYPPYAVVPALVSSSTIADDGVAARKLSVGREGFVRCGDPLQFRLP